MDISSILSSSGYNLYNLQQIAEGTSKPSMEEMTQHLIEKKDSNSNGTLDAAELCISEEVFNQVDRDGDGELTSEELIAGAEQIREAMGPPPGMPMMPPPEDDDSDEEETLLDYINQNSGENQTLLDYLNGDDEPQNPLDVLF